MLRIYGIARALRHRGWRSLVVPCRLTLSQRHRVLAAARPDVVVMQGARHDLNRVAFYPGYTIVYDLDDADFHLPHLEAPVREAMTDVRCVMAGSQYIADWCTAQGAQAHVVWTGTPISTTPAVPQVRRAPVVAWAQTAPQTYAAEAEWVLDVMARVARDCPDARLRLYDRRQQEDASFLERFRDAGIRTEWVHSARYEDYLASFDDVSVGLAPLCNRDPFCRGKSFGKVLAYLDRRVPVIASDACEHGRFFDSTTGIITNERDVWVRETKRLLTDAVARQRLADAAYLRFRERFSSEQIASQVDRVLRNCLT